MALAVCVCNGSVPARASLGVSEYLLSVRHGGCRGPGGTGTQGVPEPGRQSTFAFGTFSFSFQIQFLTLVIYLSINIC